MKSNELMIGNWLFNRNINKAMQVYPMMFSQMFRRTPESTTEDYGFYPIPLDARQLEKNGWKLNGDDAKFAPGTWTGGGLMLEQEPDGDGFRIVVTSDYDDEDTNRTPFVLHYLHELQNALRLCGIEKEIIAY